MMWRLLCAGLIALSGCRHPEIGTTNPAPRYRIVLGEGGIRRTELELEAPELVEVGDTAIVGLRMLECRSDLCSVRVPVQWTDYRWTSNRPDRLSVYEDPSIVSRHPRLIRREKINGNVTELSYRNLEESRPLIARKPGQVLITATGAQGTLQKNVSVIPAVATFAWEPNITSAHVGDTLRLSAVARDAKGKLLALATGLGTSYRETAARIQDVGQWRADQRTFVIQSSGIIEMRARLHKREAVLRINVSAAPPNN